MQYLVFIGVAISLGSAIPYILETIRGNVQPNRVTWLLWSFGPLVGAIAAFSTGITWSALPVFMGGFTPLLVLAASFVNRKAQWKLGRFDYVCGAFSILVLVVWYLTKDPNWAIALSILSDALAAAPTFIKAWKYPESEHVSTYFGGIFTPMTSFFAMKTWNFASLAFPIYLILVSLAIVFAIQHKKFLRKKYQNNLEAGRK
ncbi:MAG: hypothetical protein LBV19_02660 [Streptococcaceae bacterium]|jgi:hypothetical protein|nr:hypothetical protein [Streptococcaceae bacterium]